MCCQCRIKVTDSITYDSIVNFEVQSEEKCQFALDSIWAARSIYCYVGLDKKNNMEK